MLPALVAAPLTEAEQARNRERLKTRVRVEHIFGSQQNEQGGKLVRTIGLARAAVKIGLMNLTYNLRRFVYLENRREGTSAAAYSGKRGAIRPIGNQESCRCGLPHSYARSTSIRSTGIVIVGLFGKHIF